MVMEVQDVYEAILANAPEQLYGITGVGKKTAARIILESAANLVTRLFFDNKRYDLGDVGRYMLNRKLDMNVSLEERLITPQTLIKVILRLISVKAGQGSTDDIDHLGNRRVRCVGENC